MAQESLGFRCAGFSPACARTHSGILTSPRSMGWFPPPLHSTGNAPLPLIFRPRPSFGGPLNPDHSRRMHAGLVSYYALFKGWLLLSQPPSCHSTHTSFAILSGHSGTLAV